jgi:Inorganic Pyrophosphatase/Phage portal protein
MANLWNRFFKSESKEKAICDTECVTIPIKVGNISMYTSKVVDNRHNQKELLVNAIEPIVNRCVSAIISGTLSHGLNVKSDNEDIESNILELMRSKKWYEKSEFILNSLLGTDGDVFAFSAEAQKSKKDLFLYSVNHNGINQIEFATESIEILDFQLRKIATVPKDSLYQIKSTYNLDNDIVGTTPLMLLKERISEKQNWVNANKKKGLNGGKIEGVLTPSKDLVTNVNLQDRSNYMAELDDSIAVLSESSKNSIMNYAYIPVPVDLVQFSRSNKDEDYLGNIRDINYEICSTYEVPPSLVGFHADTDPNLSNAEQHIDYFSKTTTNKYKTKLENFWSWYIESELGYTSEQFRIFIGREPTNETIELRNQLIETVRLANEINTSYGREVVKPKLESLEQLGLELVDDTVNLNPIDENVDDSSNELDVLDELNNSSKSSNPAKKIITWNDRKIGVQFSVGDKRFGKNMPCTYGYLIKHKGEDGMALDCYVGANLASPFIYKITQIDPETGNFDEFKFMIGFSSLEEARTTYLKVIPKKYFGKISYSSILEIDKYRVVDEVKPDEEFFVKKKAKDIGKVPHVDNLVNSKPYKEFKIKLQDILNEQINQLFTEKTKVSKSDDLFTDISKRLKDNLSESELFKIISTELLPTILSDYNEFYNSNYTINNLPQKLLDEIDQIIGLTINGDGKKYEGINQTTALTIAREYAKILSQKRYSLEDYNKIPHEQKKRLWNELNKQRKSVIIESRTDLISEIIAQQSYNRVVSNLAEEDGLTWVGVRTVRDKNVRADHKLNEGLMFAISSKQPWNDFNCRCEYVFGTKQTLLELGIFKIK